MNTSPKIFVLFPTFKETKHVQALLGSLSLSSYDDVELIVSNANPGDATTDLVKENPFNHPILEIPCNNADYWSGSVNKGLRHILKHAKATDFVLLCNADSKFTPDVISSFLSLAKTHPNSILAATISHDNKVTSSGVKVLSWFLALNKHPLVNQDPRTIPSNELIPVDMLPCKCVFIPVAAIQAAGICNEKRLPHYGGDYEWTARMKKNGFPLYITTSVRATNDSQNTGHSTSESKTTLYERVSRTFSIKSTYNPIYRFWYVLHVCPKLIVPFGLLSNGVKIFLEISFSCRTLKKVFVKSPNEQSA